jgi:hypothetical protein
MIEGSGGNRLTREILMLALAREGHGAERRIDRLEEILHRSFTSDGALTEGGAHRLTEARAFRSNYNASGWVNIGNHVVWNAVGDSATGPRRDPRRADEIRYGARAIERRPFTLLIVDGVPRRDVQARFQLAFGAPPADFKIEPPRKSEELAAQPGIDQGRPTVTFVFGVQDIEHELRQDGPGASDQTFMPMRALGVRIEPSRVQLVDLTRAPYERGRVPAPLAVRPLAEHALARPSSGDALDVGVRVEGKKGTISVGDETAELSIDRPEAGFYGFVIEKPGYVSVRQLACGGLGGPK